MAEKCFICGKALAEPKAKSGEKPKEIRQRAIEKHGKKFCSAACTATYEKGLKMVEKLKDECEFC